MVTPTLTLRFRCLWWQNYRNLISREDCNYFTNCTPCECSKPRGSYQPRSQGLRGETVTKTLVKFVLSFQNFGKKIACAVRHNRIQLYCNTVVSHCACDFFSQNFGTIKWILPGSSSPSHHEGPGTEFGVVPVVCWSTIVCKNVLENISWSISCNIAPISSFLPPIFNDANSCNTTLYIHDITFFNIDGEGG